MNMLYENPDILLVSLQCFLNARPYMVYLIPSFVLIYM